MKKLLIAVLLLSSNFAFSQVREVDEAPLDNPSPEVLPENVQQGDLNTNTQVQGDNVDSSYNRTNNYNGAGSSGMPVNTAISPSLMSNGTESCLQSVTGGVQLVGLGLSSGKYMQDTECNRRRDAITLSNMGMKVAAVSLMCQNANVWRAMLLSATPCPIIRSGKLIVGKNALLAIKQNPGLHIPDYEDNQSFYDTILGVGTDESSQDQNTASVSERFRSSIRE